MIHTVDATCYDLVGKAADGHIVDERTAASNFLAPGTKIRIISKQAGPHERRRYVIHDTGSALWDGHIDLHAWSDCTTFGRQVVKFIFGWRRPTRRELAAVGR
jgi:3D (Asp-Asp-Asp) domain-containing protein